MLQEPPRLFFPYNFVYVTAASPEKFCDGILAVSKFAKLYNCSVFPREHRNADALLFGVTACVFFAGAVNPEVQMVVTCSSFGNRQLALGFSGLLNSAGRLKCRGRG